MVARINLITRVHTTNRRAAKLWTTFTRNLSWPRARSIPLELRNTRTTCDDILKRIRYREFDKFRPRTLMDRKLYPSRHRRAAFLTNLFLPPLPPPRRWRNMPLASRGDLDRGGVHNTYESESIIFNAPPEAAVSRAECASYNKSTIIVRSGFLIFSYPSRQ